MTYDDGLRQYSTERPFEGVLPNMERRFRETDSAWVREELGRYQNARTCEVCQRRAAEARGAGGQDRRARASARRRRCRSRRRATGSPASPTTLTPSQQRDRRAHPEGDQRAARVSAQCRARIPDPDARLGHAVGRREPAHPARLADRLRADRGALRARRAVDRAAPARQRAAARDAEAAARPRQHGHRRRARRGGDPHRRLARRYGAGRRRAWRPSRRRGHARRRSCATPTASPGNT